MKPELVLIKKKDIRPSGWNPRTEYEQEALKRLKVSIQSLGVIVPLIVQRSGKHFNLVAGEGRWKASKPDDKLPCLVFTGSLLEAKVLSVTENLVRSTPGEPDTEQFIASIYEQGIKEKQWLGYCDMEKKTGISHGTITAAVSAAKERKEQSLPVEGITTGDILESRPLKDKPALRRRFLEQRAKAKQQIGPAIGKGEGHIVREVSKKLAVVPEKIASRYLDGKLGDDQLDLAVKGVNEKKLTEQEIIEVIEHGQREIDRIEYGKKHTRDYEDSLMGGGKPDETFTGLSPPDPVARYRNALEAVKRFDYQQFERMTSVERQQCIEMIYYVIRMSSYTLHMIHQPLPAMVFKDDEVIDMPVWGDV